MLFALPPEPELSTVRRWRRVSGSAEARRLPRVAAQGRLVFSKTVPDMGHLRRVSRLEKSYYPLILSPVAPGGPSSPVLGPGPVLGALLFSSFLSPPFGCFAVFVVVVTGASPPDPTLAKVSKMLSL